MVDPRVKRKLDEFTEALSESKECQNVHLAREEIEKHEAARLMLKDLQAKQEKLRDIISRGEKPEEELINDYQRTMELVGFNPYISQLLRAEAEFIQMMMEIQQQIESTVGLSTPQKTDDREDQPDEPPKQSKLWTPGSSL
jgi:cell fate (sporulation/competence/biofilm development) regulator YlbF (YheA/YmcA/DUF963 family)